MEKEFTALQKFIETVVEFFVEYSFDVLGAVIILIIGVLFANQTGKLLTEFFGKKELDITLSKFITGFARLVIIALTVIIAMGKFGISIAPFIAGIGALAFGATFALQGPLSNYAAGLTIILVRPFIVGDTIMVQEQSGVVEEVKLAATSLVTEDGVRITIPNKHIVGEVLQNSKHNRIVDGMVGISYTDDPEKAIEVVHGVLKSFPEVTKKPKPQVGVNDFGDSSINIGVRYWVPTKQYYQTLYKVNLEIFKALKKAKITIPFPQRDVNLINKS